jgi:hypothetical protein
MKPNNVSLQIFSEMCPEQQQDIKELLHNIDEFGATAKGLAGSSPQSFTTFIDARDNLRKQVNDTFKNYRRVVVE